MAEYTLRTVLYVLNPVDNARSLESGKNTSLSQDELEKLPVSKPMQSFLLARLEFLRLQSCRAGAYNTLLLSVIYLMKVALGNVLLACVSSMMTGEGTDLDSNRHSSLLHYTLLRTVAIPLTLAWDATINKDAHDSTSSLFGIQAACALCVTVWTIHGVFALSHVILGLTVATLDALFYVLLFKAYRVDVKEFLHYNRNEGLSRKYLDPWAKFSEHLSFMSYVGWPMLRRITILAIVLLMPILIASNDILEVLRNSYALDDSALWRQLILSGILHGTLVTSTSFTIMAISPISVALMSLSSTALQVVVFAQADLNLCNWIVLGSCWGFSLLFVGIKILDPSSIQSAFESHRGLRFIYAVSLLSLFIAGIGPMISEHKSIPRVQVSDCASVAYFMQPNTNKKLNSSNYKDDYLGPRPDPQTFVDMTLIQARCREARDGHGVDDVLNCLSFLEHGGREYFIVPNQNIQQPPPQDRRLPGEDSDHDTVASRKLSPLSNPSAPTLNSCLGAVVPFHVYWTGSATWRVELFIKAYLYTQNLPCSRLYIWLDSDRAPDAVYEMLCNDLIFARFLPLVYRRDIVLKAWKFPDRISIPDISDPDMTGSKTPNRTIRTRIATSNDIQATRNHNNLYESHESELILDPTSADFTAVQISDAVRFFVLHHYGGIYLDMDVLLLRDMRPLVLSNHAFAEQWAERCEPHDYNTAVLSLAANSSLSTYLLRGAIRMGLNFHPRVIGRMMWKDGRNDELAMLHTAFFDPLVTDQRRAGTNHCTVPCHKNWESAFMADVENPEQEWHSYDGPPIDAAAIEAETGIRTNRTLSTFFRGSWAYHIHNQVGLLLRFTYHDI